MSKKVDKKINTYVRNHEIVLPDELVGKIYDEIIKQVDEDLTKIDFEIVIEVVQEDEENLFDIDVEVEVNEELSDHNEKLIQALKYNPKGKAAK